MSEDFQKSIDIYCNVDNDDSVQNKAFDQLVAGVFVTHLVFFHIDLTFCFSWLFVFNDDLGLKSKQFTVIQLVQMLGIHLTHVDDLRRARGTQLLSDRKCCLRQFFIEISCLNLFFDCVVIAECTEVSIAAAQLS